MACDRVERLHLPPETRTGPGIDDGLLGAPQGGRNICSQQQLAQRSFDCKLRRCRRWRRTRGEGTASCFPCRKAAIEQSHRVVAQPFQHPPQAAAVSAFVAVVHHDLHAVVQPQAAQPFGNGRALGQGVASRVNTLSRRVCTQVFVQMCRQCTCNPFACKKAIGQFGFHQIKTAVQHGAGCAVCLQGLKLGGGDQHVVHGAGLLSMFFSGGSWSGAVAQGGGGDAAGDDQGHAGPTHQGKLVAK